MPSVRSSARVAAVLASLVAFTALLAAAPAARAQVPTRDEAVQIGREAYRYGLPLLTYLDLRSRQTAVSSRTGRALVPVNDFTNAGILATWWSGGAPFPNTDTLYSIAHLDLGDGPVVLSHGDMTGRFFVFQMIDAYTNTFAYVGTRTTGSAPGRFALTWSGAPAAVAGARTIASPTRRVWVIGRTLTTGGPLDIAAARAAQRTYGLERVRAARVAPGAPSARAAARAARKAARKAAIAAHAKAVRRARAAAKRRRKATGVTSGTRARIAAVPTGDAYLERLARALRDNPPPAQDAPLLARLARAGIGPGSTPEGAGMPSDVVAGVRAGVDAEAAELPDAARSRVFGAAVAGGGWYVPPPNFGNFGTDYGLRADSVIVGLAGHRPEEASYRLGMADSTGAQLDGSHSYRITFPSEPPAQAFWSLTLYDLDGDLPPVGGGGRAAIGDTHPPLRRRADGSVVVVVQEDAPAEAGVNWLQAPDKPFRLDLRLYTPDASVLSGAWRPPAIVRTR